jgi:Tir chaperone protein (CesT) family
MDGEKVEATEEEAPDELEPLLRQLCEAVGFNDVDGVIERRLIEVEGFECSFDTPAADAGALYLLINFGLPMAGRTLKVFRAMLESNLLVYAQDQAQLGIDPETGTVLLIVRVFLGDDIDGAWLADTITHYCEHGRYWRDHLLCSEDEMYNGILSGEYFWIRA